MNHLNKVLRLPKRQSDFERYQRVLQLKREIVRDWDRLKRAWEYETDRPVPADRALDMLLMVLVKRGIL